MNKGTIWRGAPSTKLILIIRPATERASCGECRQSADTLQTVQPEYLLATRAQRLLDGAWWLESGEGQARTKLLGMLGMTMVMAARRDAFYGEIMWMLTQLLNATRDDDEPEWDADTEFRLLLDRAFGATGDEAVRHGLINAFMGIDVSSRIKLDDLW